MYRFAAYHESMQNEWDEFALHHGTIFHSIGFRSILLESFGYRCAYQAILDSYDRICGVFPLVIGHSLGWKRVGVSLPFVNQLDICTENKESGHFVMQELPLLSQKLGLDRMELRLKEQDADRTVWSSRFENHTFVLSLFEEEGETLAQASAGCRNHVRKTYRNGWFESSFDPEQLPVFYEVYVRRMKQLGSPAPDIGFFRRFFIHLPEHASLLTIRDKSNHQVVGGMLLLKSPGDSTIYYPYGAGRIEYNNRYLNSFMYWEAVRFGIRCGMKKFDMGRSQTDSGTYRFKSQWGAEPIQLKYLRHGAQESDNTPSERERLQPLSALWKRIPRFLTDRIGEKVIKFLLP